MTSIVLSCPGYSLKVSKPARIYLFVALGATLLLVGGGLFLLVIPPDPVPVPLVRHDQSREDRARARQAEEESASRALLAAGSRQGGNLSPAGPAPEERLKPWKEARSLSGGVSARLESFRENEYMVFRLELTGARKVLEELRGNQGHLLIEIQDASGKKILAMKVKKKDLLAVPGKGGRLMVSPLVAAACSAETAATVGTWQVSEQ